MKIQITDNLLLATREKSDKAMKTESQLLYQIKNILNKMGYNLIKKEMAKDGHLVSEGQYYLRPKFLPKDEKKNVAIYNTHWQINSNEKDFNKAGTHFTIVKGYF